MSSADFTDLGLVLGAADVARGVTSGTSKPTGGGTFVFAMNSLTNTPGVYGKRATPQAPNTNFDPMSKGCDISAAICRDVGGGLIGWSGFIFASLQGPDADDIGYMLGLSDGNPSHIELRKGAIIDGLPDESPGNPNKILRQSTETIAVGTWVHLRLEVIDNDNGDVILNCYRNAGNVTTPTWANIAGMASFVDDVAAINTGSVPIIGGRAGWAAKFSESTRRFFVDQIAISRQT